MIQARPFVKWVGGKRQLLPELFRHVPERFNVYHEPFLGGGALFFALQPARSVLSDANARLVRTYIAIRDAPADAIGLLKSYPYDREFYYTMRNRDPEQMHDRELAAWFIYMNKSGFNGLYRVNKSGRFNVPFGRYTNPTICDEENILACSRALQSARIVCGNFKEVLTRSHAGDFVYFDPPYVPLSATSSFQSYTADGFTADNQQQLRDVALTLKRLGVRVLLSNSASPAVYDLYRNGFNIEEVEARRAVNCNAGSRSAVKELLIW